MAWLRHLALRCRDLGKSRHFYEQLIGWQFVGFRPSGESLDLTDGVNNITLLQHPREAAARRQSLPEGDEFIHFGVVVGDVAAVFCRLRAAGAPLVRESVKDRNDLPADWLPGPSDSFKTLDPDGNVIDITGNRQEWRGVALPGPHAAAT